MTIIAIYGSSCVGKTSVGRALADGCNLRFRSCGEAVKKRGSELGVDWRDLDSSHHRSIDGDTLAWASAEQGGVIEGRYLDAVLEEGLGVAFVLLTASNEVRLSRWKDRLGRPVSDDELEEFDRAEAAFRASMYGASTGSPAIKIDTSALSNDEVATLIRSEMNRL